MGSAAHLSFIYKDWKNLYSDHHSRELDLEETRVSNTFESKCTGLHMAHEVCPTLI